MTSRADLGIKTTRLFFQQCPDGTSRLLDMTSAYDLREAPDGRNYGIHGAELWFGLKRGDVAVELQWMTPWMLSANRRQDGREFDGLGCVRYHSPVALHEHQSSAECDILGAKPCFSDASYTASREIFDKAVADPEELWKELLGWLERTERRVKEAQEAERNFS